MPFVHIPGKGLINVRSALDQTVYAMARAERIAMRRAATAVTRPTEPAMAPEAIGQHPDFSRADMEGIGSTAHRNNPPIL